MYNTNTSNKIEITNVKYAEITESSCQKITELEKKIEKETGEKVALVAYHLL